MSNYSFKDGGKGYKPPYPGHEAMCVVKGSSAKNNSSSMVGSKKVTEGKRANLLSQEKTSSKHGDRGYQTPKVTQASKRVAKKRMS